jgi:putative transposase
MFAFLGKLYNKDREVKVVLFHKAYLFQIYPNHTQIELIKKTIGCSRFVFNFFLSKQKEKDIYWYIVKEMVQKGQFSTNSW